MGYVIVVANQKGGVGKTATAVTLTAGLTKRGFKVLGIDMDPQGHMGNFMGADRNVAVTMYNVLKREVALSEIVQQTKNGLIAVSNILLSGLEQELNAIGKEFRLSEVLKPIKDEYDFVVIDTSPALGVLTANAFTAADGVLIPVDPDEGSIDGLLQLNDTINVIKQYCNQQLEVLGIFFNCYNANRVLGRGLHEITGQLANQLNVRLLNTTIRRAEALPASRTARVNILDYDPKSTVATDYNALIEEVLALIQQ